MILHAAAALSAALLTAEQIAPPVPPDGVTPRTSAAAAAPSAPARYEGPDPAVTCCLVPEGQVVEIEIVDALTSRTNRHGDIFPIRLAEPILVDGTERVPAGAQGVGQVIQGARGRMGGGPGELTLAVRYLEHAGQRIPLHRLRFFARGRNNEGVAAAVLMSPMIGPLSIFITGGEVQVPAGTRVQAQVAADTRLSTPQQVQH